MSAGESRSGPSKPKKHTESTWSWMLSNLDDPKVKTAHERVLQLLEYVPVESRDEIMRRLQDKPPEQFDGAMLELSTAEILLKSHARLSLATHESRPGEGKPDFDVLLSGTLAAYAECTVFKSGMAKETREMLVVTSFIRECGKRMTVPGFSMSVMEWTAGDREPSSRMIARKIDEHLRVMLVEKPVPAQPAEFVVRDEASGWEYVLRPIPTRDPTKVPSDMCGEIGVVGWEQDPGETLRREVVAKLRKYKNKPASLVVAVCCPDWWGNTDKDTVYDVLLGKLRHWVPRQGEGVATAERAAGGLFVDSATASNGLLGLLTVGFDACRPWAPPAAHTLWANPNFATHDLVREWRGPLITWDPESGDVVERNGASATGP